MNLTLKRPSGAALAAVTVSAVSAALLSASPSAASARGENTWIRTVESVAGHHLCVTTTRNQLSPGRWEADVRYCFNGARDQLWDRQGANIKLIDTNQCLDSNGAGQVYYMECNGGDYQKWNYHANGQVTNRATGRYLEARYVPGWPRPVPDNVLGTTTTPGSWGENVSSNKWQFFGGA